MTDDEFRLRALELHASQVRALQRIASALEQFAPPKVQPTGPPADIDRLTAPTLEDLVRWEREDKDQQPPIL